MRKPRGYWTYERCKEEALKYEKIILFKKYSVSAYNTSYRKGWMNELCSHMKSSQKPKGYWTFEKCEKLFQSYELITNFEKDYPFVYRIIKKNEWDDIIFKNAKYKQKPKGYWTYERCKEEALKYKSKSNFQKKCYQAYYISLKNGWLDNICSHMDNKYKFKGYWTYERCKEEALKYNSRSDFNKNSISAYNKSYKNGWLDKICSHMKIKNNNTKRCIYAYEFDDNHVYIGLTYNLEKRHYERFFNDNDVVNKHMKKIKRTPKRKQLTDYISTKKAVSLEEFYVKEYKNNNWIILNKSKTGAIGGKLMWTYERCKEEALKYKSRYKFIKNSKGAYASSLKNGWLDDVCSHMIPTQKPTGYWTYERCKEEALKYDIKKHYRKSSPSYYKAYKKGWLDDFFPKKQ